MSAERQIQRLEEEASKNAVLTREHGGVRVELRYHRAQPVFNSAAHLTVWVRIGMDDTGQWKEVEPEHALDMFEHPFAYGFEFE